MLVSDNDLVQQFSQLLPCSWQAEELDFSTVQYLNFENLNNYFFLRIITSVL